MKYLLPFLLIFCFNYAIAQNEIIDSYDYNLAVKFYTTARQDHKLQRYGSAIKNFTKAFNLNPDNSDYSFGLASSYYEMEEYDSAGKYIENATALEPNQPDYHYLAGNIFFHQQDYPNAFKNYTVALNNLNENYPINTVNCHYNKGVSAYYLKDYNSTILDLTAILRQYEDHTEALYLRGVSYLKIKKNKEACRDFNRAHKLGYNNSMKYIDQYCEK